ncbi:hypothetical protein GLOIN_2v1770412 [Rhizophagus irregularis DAOM 181602=DAOM 197198]|nr:hypothetical protein GLOIN_2v1770412 [Rhizophagus irregularis DAOM 181602=DAOM 197198]
MIYKIVLHKITAPHFYFNNIEQIPNIFGCFPIDEPKYVLFSHIPSHLIIYYLGNCENFTENMGFLISINDNAE